MKRVIDLFGASVGLLLLAPLFLLVALLVKITSRGPIFFTQIRVGKNFVPFRFLKFRTMTVQEAAGPLVTSSSDGRITTVGRFLRRTKLDELPQLLNVLRGDMSLVGPRPEVPKFIQMFEQDYKDILRIRPGITDWNSLEFMDEEMLLRNEADVEKSYIEKIMPLKIRNQRRYVDSRSFWVDMDILARTVGSVVFRRGASHHAEKDDATLKLT